MLNRHMRIYGGDCCVQQCSRARHYDIFFQQQIESNEFEEETSL